MIGAQGQSTIPYLCTNTGSIGMILKLSVGFFSSFKRPGRSSFQIPTEEVQTSRRSQGLLSPGDNLKLKVQTLYAPIGRGLSRIFIGGALDKEKV